MARIGKTTKIGNWYRNNFPTDDLGKYVKNITFETLFDCISNGVVPYHVIGVEDSVIRERLFEETCKIFKISYDELYNMWLKSSSNK